MIKSKKLSSLVAASLILAGGSFLGVQTVSADDDTRLDTRLGAVEALASQNSSSIIKLEETVNKISTTPEQLQQIATNKKDIATNKTDIATNKTDIAANKTAIADEATARTDADTKLDTRITNVKDYLEKQTAADYVSKSDAAVQDGAVAKAGNTIGENVTNLDGALAKETAARIGADAAQDKVIKGVNDNLVSSVNTINKNIGTITDQLNKNDLAEAQARDAADQKLQGNIDAEAKARTDADTKLDTRITNVKEYLENQTAADYVSKSDAAVQDGAVVKADKTIGENVTNLDGALAKETAARIGADAAQDKVIQQVNQNVADGFNTINKNIGTITDQLNKNDLAEQQARAEKDTEHDNAIAANQKDIATNKTDIAKIQDDLKASNLNEMSKTAASLKGYATQMSTVQALAAGNKKNIDQNTTDIATNKKDIATNKTAIDKNKTAIGDEAAARESGDNALQNQIKKESAARQADISRLDNKIHDVSKEVDTVGALSMAMSGLHPLSYDEGDARFQLSAAVGTYDGTEALALGGFYHFNRDSMLSVGVATDLGADEHRMGANVGYTRRIGQGGHVSRPSEGTVSDIMKDIKNLEQKQAKLEQENEQLKQQLAALKK